MLSTRFKSISTVPKLSAPQIRARMAASAALTNVSGKARPIKVPLTRQRVRFV
jgi:hypothetical protein